MKTDLSINVQVNLGLTEQMAAVVNAILEQLQPRGFGRYQESAQPRGFGRYQESAQPANIEEPTPVEAPAEAKPEMPQAEAPKALTEEDIRKAMHEARQRIEGEDYREHTDSEAYKKYHRQLTAQFKNIAAELGADKPSLLPEDKRASFISSCEELKVLDDGTIGVVVPF